MPLQILGDNIKVVIFSCSEYEVRNYGMSDTATKVELV